MVDSPDNHNRKKKRKRKAKSKLAIHLEYALFMIGWSIMRMMPLHMAYAISKGLFRIGYLLDFKHRKRTVSHLIHAGIAHDLNEATKTGRKVFDNFSKLLVEIVKFDQLVNPENINESVSVIGDQETIERSIGKNNEPMIFITAHYGNWELAGTAFSLLSSRPIASIMRPFNNPLIGRKIIASRESDNHQSLPREGALRHMLRALKEGKSIAILADQHAGSKEGVLTEFFGQPARTHASPALLHLKTGIPIAVSVNRRIDNDFHFEFIAAPLITYQPTGDKEKDIIAVTQMITSTLEKLIRQEPEQWLWAHRRWLNLHRRNWTPPPDSKWAETVKTDDSKVRAEA